MSKMTVLKQMLAFPLRNGNRLKNTFYKIGVKSFSMNTPRSYAYDPDGKTIVSVMNNEQDAPLMINSYSLLGFRLNNGCFVIGPMAIFPHSILSWNIKDDYEINEKSLSLFLRLHPRLDVLLIGLSDGRNQQLILETKRSIRSMLGNIKEGEGLNVEVLPTEKAVTTFNFLNTEKRFVGAALIPPTNYTATLDDQYKIEYLNRKTDDDYLLPSFK